jgi:hypothetical protein
MKVYRPAENKSVIVRALISIRDKARGILISLKTNKKCYPQSVSSTKDRDTMKEPLSEESLLIKDMNEDIQLLKTEVECLKRQLSCQTGKRSFKCCDQFDCCRKEEKYLKKSDSCPECLDQSKTKKVKVV